MSVSEYLLAQRNPAGHWEGELSTSALSTATAIFALHLHHPQRHESLVAAGLRWLVEHQNPDGGWGDTVKSISNISTTALCWAALTCGEVPPATVDAVERYLARAAGSLERRALAEAIAQRYGRDRTFSVPILTMCALAGRLGEAAGAFGLIPQLPFELAACPHQWFKFLQLPVVSYALPALIAMGLVRHTHRPTRNPIARIIRHLARERTLRVLGEIQPAGGGFLEATPLTSFVCMSLVGAGLREHPVVQSGVEFLVRSVRPDGSWPIDTNLATWVTTLSINALGPDLPAEARGPLLEWLLGQQYRVEHAYTHAAPGGWAWTDLPGGVPDADDTAGALIALHNLAVFDDRTLDAARMGITWLLDLQNRDGGIPTFCRGWGSLPFDRSGADLTAHAISAFRAWRDRLPDLRPRINRATERAIGYLRKTQRPDGSWLPLWFGNQHAPDDENPTYGTARVVMALAAVDAPELLGRAVEWLLSVQNASGGWGGAPGVEPSIEETALAVHALVRSTGFSLNPEEQAKACTPNRRVCHAIERGIAWLMERTHNGQRFDPSPIGFYFAKLWYFERLYPAIFTTAAVRCAASLRAV